mmetsp:Transcript_19644/g.55248  ORF Transcript_19644/g.55248 Transcript_19644/m.55248 type:complete len:443 (-) Transcript_19644:355-1683(-)
MVQGHRVGAGVGLAGEALDLELDVAFFVLHHRVHCGHDLAFNDGRVILEEFLQRIHVQGHNDVRFVIVLIVGGDLHGPHVHSGLQEGLQQVLLGRSVECGVVRGFVLCLLYQSDPPVHVFRLQRAMSPRDLAFAPCDLGMRHQQVLEQERRHNRGHQECPDHSSVGILAQHGLPCRGVDRRLGCLCHQVRELTAAEHGRSDDPADTLHPEAAEQFAQAAWHGSEDHALPEGVPGDHAVDGDGEPHSGSEEEPHEPRLQALGLVMPHLHRPRDSAEADAGHEGTQQVAPHKGAHVGVHQDSAHEEQCEQLVPSREADVDGGSAGQGDLGQAPGHHPREDKVPKQAGGHEEGEGEDDRPRHAPAGDVPLGQVHEDAEGHQRHDVIDKGRSHHSLPQAGVELPRLRQQLERDAHGSGSQRAPRRQPVRVGVVPQDPHEEHAQAEG